MSYKLWIMNHEFMFGQLWGGHSGINPGHSGAIPGSFRGHSKVIPGSFQGHSRFISGSFRRHSRVCCVDSAPAWIRHGASTNPAQIRHTAPHAPVADSGPLLPLEEPSSETVLGKKGSSRNPWTTRCKLHLVGNPFQMLSKSRLFWVSENPVVG